MKIQCPCGARLEIDAVTPDRLPAAFPCPSCGQDLVPALRQLASPPASSGATTPPLAVVLPSSPGPLRVAVPATAVAAPAPEPTAPATPVSAPVVCPRHGFDCVEQCRVCRKPICPRCLEMFGYVCSVPCREAAARAGLELPVYEQQATLVRARADRKARRLTLAIAAALTVLAGAWGWMHFVAAKPRAAATVKFSDALDDGEVRLVAPGQALVRRGARLSRMDLAAGKEVWGLNLSGSAGAWFWHAHGTNVWAANGRKLIQHDWHNGSAAREVNLPGTITLLSGDNAALVVLAQADLGRQRAVRVNLVTGEVQQQEVAGTTTDVNAIPSAGPSTRGPAPVAPGGETGPAPIRAARAVAGLGQRPLPEDDTETPAVPAPVPDAARSEIVAGSGSLVQLTVKLLEARSIAVPVMKPAPGRSALDGPVNAAATVGIVNETLNELQRESTGGVEREDASRYQVRVQRLAVPEAAAWTGEVIGTPSVHPLRTLDLILAGRKLLALEAGSSRKLWESQLAYAVPDLSGEWVLGPEDTGPAGPCVQRGDTVFVFDLGVLTAFEAASGQVRWRLPSVGVSGLLFDEAGALYVNTTDADQDTVKFRQQIDIEHRVRSLILKVDARNGKVLWQTRNHGRLLAATGGMLYAAEWAGGAERTRSIPGTVHPHVRIYRLDAGNGQPAWEYYEGRPPVALDFRRNTFALLFRNELRLVKFTPGW